VLDGTPVLLRSHDDLSNVCDQAIHVATVDAVEFFDAVQVRQLMPVDRDKPLPLHLWNSVEREANELIEGDGQIEEQEWNCHGANYGCGSDIARLTLSYPSEESDLELLMCSRYGFLKLYPGTFELITELHLVGFDRVFQFFLEAPYLAQ